MLLSPSLWETCECFLFPPQPRNFSSPTKTGLLQEEAALGTMLGFGLFPTWSQSWGMCPPWHKQLLQSPGKSLLHGIVLDVSLTKQAKLCILNPASILSSWKTQIETSCNCFKQLNMHYNCSAPPSNHEKCSLVGNKWSQNMDCSYANRVSFPLKFF